MVRLQQLAVPCLLAGAAVPGVSAGGVRAGRSAAMASRSLTTTTATSLGCFTDAKDSRRLSKGLMRQTNLTHEVCYDYCATAYSFYALQFGSECWCGSNFAEISLFGKVLDPAEDCAMPCTGDDTDTCGGYNSFELFQYELAPQPEGHLGCYADSKTGRLFQNKNVDDNLTAESCKATCSESGNYAYYGLQYGRECWCGLSTEDYTLYKDEPSSCGYRCAGDSGAICGGYTNMNIFSIDGSTPAATVPPTPTPSTDPTEPGATAPPTPETTATTPPTTAPPTTAPPTPETTATVPPTPTPSTDPTEPGATAPPTPETTATAPPTTAPPTTAPPTTAPPTTAPPTTAPPTPETTVTPGAVQVDLVPCILSSTEISESTAGPYVMELFFKGYWTPKTITEIVSNTDTILDIIIDADGKGLCSAVYVDITGPSDAQYAELASYSAQFKVRIVYFSTTFSFDNANVNAKLGIEPFFEGAIEDPALIQLTEAGGALATVTTSSLATDPRPSDLTVVPVRKTGPVDNVVVLAEYADEDGVAITSGDLDSAGLVSWAGTDGSEELYLFYPIAWFDAESWAWAHYINEWATKGIFMGERRFYLGAVVDDLFLATPEWEYGVDQEEEVGSRCSADDMEQLRSVQKELNAQYNSEIVTEFANNAAGILEKVESIYLPPYVETAVTIKGTKWESPGQPEVHDINWLADSVPAMQLEFADGMWNDDLLLMDVLEDLKLETPSFFHQSHTLIHLSRDQLRESDCFTEDTGNVQIALLTGMWDSDNYNWRSMVSPGITGLFNENCLKSAAENLMTCFPGDNTYDGTTPGSVLLVNKEEPYHSLYTSVEDNGYDGSQIVPRFATFVYFNCVTGACLVAQNKAIRRSVCDCENLDPSMDKGVCTSTELECVTTIDGETVTDIQSFQSVDEVFETEAATTTRYLLAGRRDKYMFHQANIIPASDLGGMSSLERWYKDVLASFSKLITFPVKTVKFDDLCTNFQLHEALDKFGGHVTMTVEEDGSISDMSYNAGSGAGLVPLTVPTALVASIPIESLSAYQYASEEYGTDTTYYLADAEEDIPAAAVKPDVSLLAAVPGRVSAAEEAETIIQLDPAAEEEMEEETKEAMEENNAVLNQQGFIDELGAQQMVDATTTGE